MFRNHFTTMGDLARLREIAAIMARYGLSGFFQRLRLSVNFRQDKQAAEAAHQHRYLSMPQRMRRAFEELGPTFIKLGQVLSTRVDIFGSEWTDAFAELQSNVRPIATDDIRALIQAQLERPLDQVFRHIDPRPIGSASIAQVHRAVLVSGEEVAVKIKRPDIDATIAADLRILTHIANLIEAEIPESRRYRPVQMVQYFARSLARETDLSVELRYLQRFGRAYEGHEFIRIPQVFAAYSNRQLLVQEFIDDTLLNDLPVETLDANTRRLLATRVTDALLGMILQHGFFHADPHPGNIFISSDGRISLIDFGLVGNLGSTRRREIITLINALIARDPFAMQYVLSNWAQGELPDENLLGADVLEMLLNYEHTAMKDLRISQVINDITHIMRTHELTLPGDLVMLFKTLITLEGVVKRLDGDFELLAHAKPIVQDIMRLRFEPGHVFRKSRMHAQMLTQVADELPQNVLRLSRRIQKGQFSVNLDIERIEHLNHQLDRITNRLTMGIVTAALIIGSSIVMNIDAGPKLFGLPFFGLIGYLLAFANSMWVIWSIWRSGKH